MAQLHFELVTPEKLLRSEAVYMVVVPGTEGDFGVLAGHAPFMSTIRPGAISIFRAEGATPLADVEPTKVDRDLSNAREDIRLAKSAGEASVAEKQIERLTALKEALAA